MSDASGHDEPEEVRDLRGKVIAALNIGAQAFIKSMESMIAMHVI